MGKGLIKMSLTKDEKKSWDALRNKQVDQVWGVENESYIIRFRDGSRVIIPMTRENTMKYCPGEEEQIIDELSRINCRKKELMGKLEKMRE
jgi:hypothetical protein